MRIGPLSIEFDWSGLRGTAQLATVEGKAQPPSLSSVESRGLWWPIVREPSAGAWQRNLECSTESILSYAPVRACVTLIASDIGKLRIMLMQEDDDGIWSEVENPAFSPVLRKPNHYQTRIKFLENWITSKLIHGNTYVLKQRDNRGVVTALYILDPGRVRVLVATDGSVFYELQPDNLSKLQPSDRLIVPANEIIHDVNVPLWHPLVGVSPISACLLPAAQGLRVQENSTTFFGNGSTASGVLSTDQLLSDEDSARIQKQWEAGHSGANQGRVAVLGWGLKYEQLSMSAVDAQLIEQLKWTAEQVCTAFHVPPYMIGVGPPPNYNNIEALNVQYYTQCLQNPIECIELLLDEGLGLAPDRINGQRFGTELDLDELLRMDTATRVKAAAESIGSGAVSPNEARKMFYGLPPVTGGETPYLQNQNFSLEDLARRSELAQTTLPPAPLPAVDVPAEPEALSDEQAASMATIIRKEWGL